MADHRSGSYGTTDSEDVVTDERQAYMFKIDAVKKMYPFLEFPLINFIEDDINYIHIEYVKLLIQMRKMRSVLDDPLVTMSLSYINILFNTSRSTS